MHDPPSPPPQKKKKKKKKKKEERKLDREEYVLCSLYLSKVLERAGHKL